MLKNNLVRMSPSTILGLAYAMARLEKELEGLRKEVNEVVKTVSSKSIPDNAGGKMLLSKSGGQLIADCLNIPEIAVEIKRAIWQEERSLKGKQEYQEEKQELEEATKKSSR